MGGSAFSSGDRPLNTPRMPREVYEAVKNRCLAVLKELYLAAASPIEGPGKQDFGDVDIALACPVDDTLSTRESVEVISGALGAARVIVNENSSSNLALPWPVSVSPSHDSGAADGGQAGDKYVQVDVTICKSAGEMQWHLFRHAHGDMWNILGSIIRPCGLTMGHDALWLRVSEIEKSDKNRAKIFLTSEPSRVLDFLGLPAARYWHQPFQDLEAMYEYMAQCRMFWVCPSDSAQQGGDTADSDAVQGGRKLNSSERKRMRQRPAYRIWIDEFIVQCREAGRFSDRRTTREQVTREACSEFGVESEYNARRDAFLLDRQRVVIWNELIKGSISQPDRSDAGAVMYRGCLVKALKRIILDGDGSYGVSPEGAFRGDDGFYLLERVADFINRYQDRVGEAAMNRHKEKYAKNLGAKGAKTRAQAQAQAEEE